MLSFAWCGPRTQAGRCLQAVPAGGKRERREPRLRSGLRIRAKGGLARKARPYVNAPATRKPGRLPLRLRVTSSVGSHRLLGAGASLELVARATAADARRCLTVRRIAHAIADRQSLPSREAAQRVSI